MSYLLVARARHGHRRSPLLPLVPGTPAFLTAPRGLRATPCVTARVPAVAALCPRREPPAMPACCCIGAAAAVSCFFHRRCWLLLPLLSLTSPQRYCCSSSRPRPACPGLAPRWRPPLRAGAPSSPAAPSPTASPCVRYVLLLLVMATAMAKCGVYSVCACECVCSVSAEVCELALVYSSLGLN